MLVIWISNGNEKKKKRSSAEPKTHSHTTHKGQPKARMPQNSTLTFSHPKTTCKEQKIEKNEEEQKKPTKLQRGQTIRNRRQNLHFTQQK